VAPLELADAVGLEEPLELPLEVDPPALEGAPLEALAVELCEVVLLPFPQAPLQVECELPGESVAAGALELSGQPASSPSNAAAMRAFTRSTIAPRSREGQTLGT
jgi:hypothetical protein